MLSVSISLLNIVGGPSWIRTKDQSVMSRTLLPAELKVQILKAVHLTPFTTAI